MSGLALALGMRRGKKGQSRLHFYPLQEKNPRICNCIKLFLMGGIGICLWAPQKKFWVLLILKRGKVCFAMPASALDTVFTDFLIKLGIKPRMHLWEISIFDCQLCCSLIRHFLFLVRLSCLLSCLLSRLLSCLLSLSLFVQFWFVQCSIGQLLLPQIQLRSAELS